MAKGNTIRRSHKDTVFNDLFSDKRNALSLFNALNDTDYQDADSHTREERRIRIVPEPADTLGAPEHLELQYALTRTDLLCP